MAASIYAVLLLAPVVLTVILLLFWHGLPAKGEGGIRTGICVLAVLGTIFSPVYAGSPMQPVACLLAPLAIFICGIFVKRLPIAIAAGVLFAIVFSQQQRCYEQALAMKGVTDLNPSQVANREGRNF